MAVVKDYMMGNCRIIIHDDSCVKTQEEKDQILNNIADIYYRHYVKLAQAAAANNENPTEGEASI